MLSPKAGNKSDLVWFGLTSKSFPIWAQLPSLRISPASQVPPTHLQLLLATSRCPWCQQISAQRMHLSPGLLHSFQGSSSPFLQEALCAYDFPLVVTVGHNCPPHCSFRAETIFIHVTRRLVHGPFPSVGWMNSSELETQDTWGLCTGWKNAFLVLHGHPASTLFFHFSLIVGILFAE